MKKPVFTVLLCIALMMFSSCTESAGTDKSSTIESAPPSLSSQTSETGISESLPETNEVIEPSENTRHVAQTLSSGVVVDADVNISPTVDLSSLNTYEAKLQLQSFDEIVSILAPEKTIVTQETQLTKESRVSDEYTYAIFEDDSIIATGGDIIIYSRPTNDTVSTLFSTGGNDKNDYSFLTGKDLSFASIEEAVSEADKIINAFGIHVLPPVCYTLDYMTMTDEALKRNRRFNIGLSDEEIAELPEDEIVTVSPEDECYILRYPLALDNMPVSMYESGSFGDGSFMAGTSVEVFYSKDGIIDFYMQHEFSDDFTVLDTQAGMNEDEALDFLDAKYNSIILEGDYIVDSISFEYIPLPVKGESNLFTLVPVWRFSTAHTFMRAPKFEGGEPEEWTDRASLVFNAVSGEEIITDYGRI